MPLALVACFSSAFIHTPDKDDMTAFQRVRSHWMACYLAEHIWWIAIETLALTVYSYPDTIEDRIDFSNVIA